MKLYKKDSNGKIRFIEVVNRGDEVVQISGLVDTENPVTHTKKSKPKNVGKKNETTAERQAELEAKAIIVDKLTKGYFKTKAEAEHEMVMLPMLAKDYKKESKKINWEGSVYCQPKLDGMRCLVTIGPGKVTFKSRDGKVINTMIHMEEEFKYITDVTKRTVTYDGELYCHGLTFQENMELIKKITPETKNVKFHCYDMVSDSSFSDRKDAIDDLADADCVSFVETNKIKSHDDLVKFHKKYLEEGYEGSIVRHGNLGYQIDTRSVSLLKYKDFQDIAAKIVDIEPANKRPEWGVPVLEYKGKRFRAGMKYSHKERVDFLKNKDKYIGKIAEIRFFEWTDDGLPRFPVMVGMRLDKSKADE